MWLYDDELAECIETIEQIRLKVTLGLKIAGHRYIVKQNKICFPGQRGFQFSCWKNTTVFIEWAEYDKFLAQR